MSVGVVKEHFAANEIQKIPGFSWRHRKSIKTL